MVENSASSTVTDLVELTLEQLRVEICRIYETCDESDKGAWRLLSDLAIEMTSSVRDNSLVEGYHWALLGMEVEGFRGAKQSINIAFDSMPGVTVLHGENGSGKSSITEALRMALEGQVGLTHFGAKANIQDLWGSVDERSSGTETSLVSVHFQDADKPDVRLSLKVKFDGKSVLRTAELRAESGDIIFFPEDSSAWTQWNSALRAAPPIFAYAELANELQKRGDLQTWLSACLAMDTANREFNSAVAERQTKARVAKNAIESARVAADVRLSDVDRVATESGISEITAIQWGALEDQRQLDLWLATQDLSERIKQDKPLPKDLYLELLDYSENYKELKTAWITAAKAALNTPVATALVDLDNKIRESHQEDNEGICPVCGAQSPHWQGHLHEQALSFVSAHKASERLDRHVRLRHTKLFEPIRNCLPLISHDYQDTSAVNDVTHMLAHPGVASSTKDDLDPSVLDAIDALCAWVRSDSAKTFVNTAVSVADLRHQWLCERWDAMTPFLKVWQENYREALVADEWKTALSRWNTHLATLRKGRSAKLRELVSPMVSALLGDVGIELALLEVNKIETKLILKNRRGEEVELSHLSAGQRNALILGPILGTIGGGIFKFCFLDDPVHAFDDFRVDQLAATLANIGQKQSLIVTTHDGRFVEYLRVHAPRIFSVFLTTRDDLGNITLAPSDISWKIVLDHASMLLIRAGNRITDEGRADIAALLRMSMDESFEMLSLRYLSTLNSEDRKTQSGKFAEAMTIVDRASQLRIFLNASPQLTAFESAYGHVSGYIKSWSKSTHDPSTAPSSEELKIQIIAAEASCKSLELIRW